MWLKHAREHESIVHRVLAVGLAGHHLSSELRVHGCHLGHVHVELLLLPHHGFERGRGTCARLSCAHAICIHSRHAGHRIEAKWHHVGHHRRDTIDGSQRVEGSSCGRYVAYAGLCSCERLPVVGVLSETSGFGSFRGRNGDGFALLVLDMVLLGVDLLVLAQVLRSLVAFIAGLYRGMEVSAKPNCHRNGAATKTH